MSPSHVIDRVALRGIGDPAASRAWTRRALEPADLDGIVPPAATLVLRSAALSGGRPGAALRRAACDAARTASRPATGPVGASAAAVLFADDAELLACITRDLLDGTFGVAWWWAAYRRGSSGDPVAVVARTWVERAPAAPAALHALARTGHAAAALRLLPEPAVRELAAAAVTAGVLAPAVAAQVLTAPVPPASGAAPAREPGEPRDARPAPEPGERRDTPSPQEPRPELAAAVADVAAADGPAAVLGAALLLAHRSPAVLAAIPEGALAHAVAHARAPRPPAPQPEPIAAPAAPVRVTAGDDPLLVARPAEAAPARRTRTRPRPVPPVPASGAVAALSPPARRARAERAGAPDAEPLPHPGAGVRTPLAGAFLLLTVACDLGLYPDFTRPRDRGLPMSPWTWLAHTTAQLVGVRDPDDPLWTLLADLAGDPGAAPPGRAPELRTTTRRVARRLDTALGRRKSARWVVVRTGTVHAGPARVDVTYALDDLDIAIRTCGLDSDPGWLPAAARDVRLHYR